MSIIGEEDWIQTDTGKGRPLVFPNRARRFDRVVKSNTKCVVAGFYEGLSRIPVNADGRLAGSMLACRRGAQRGGNIFRSRIDNERRCSWRWRRRQRSGGPRGDGERRDQMSAGRKRSGCGHRAYMPHAIYWIGQGKVFFTSSG